MQAAGWTAAAAAVARLRAACRKGRLVDGHVWEVDALHAGVAQAVDRKEAHALVEAGRQQQLPIGVELHAAHDCLGRVGLHSKEWPAASASAGRRRGGQKERGMGRVGGPAAAPGWRLPGASSPAARRAAATPWRAGHPRGSAARQRPCSQIGGGSRAACGRRRGPGASSWRPPPASQAAAGRASPIIVAGVLLLCGLFAALGPRRPRVELGVLLP